jgi:hypothetical protein
MEQETTAMASPNAVITRDPDVQRRRLFSEERAFPSKRCWTILKLDNR